jgi:hypothetical protein
MIFLKLVLQDSCRPNIPQEAVAGGSNVMMVVNHTLRLEGAELVSAAIMTPSIN